MLLRLVSTMQALKVDERQFFSICHVYCFGTAPDIGADVARYKLHSIIPTYVIRFLKENAQCESSVPVAGTPSPVCGG